MWLNYTAANLFFSQLNSQYFVAKLQNEEHQEHNVDVDKELELNSLLLSLLLYQIDWSNVWESKQFLTEFLQFETLIYIIKIF